MRALALAFALGLAALAGPAPLAAQDGRAALAAMETAGIVRHADIAYQAIEGVAPERQLLDVYTREGLSGAPVVLFVHGGSWYQGSKAAVGVKPIVFAQNGFLTVSTHYRFRPDVEVADQAQDIARAAAWIHANIAAYGGDPERIFLMGHSAGAHLVSVVGTNRTFLETAGLSFAVIPGVISLDTGPYDVRKQMAGINPEVGYGKLMAFVFGQDDSKWDAVSPIRHIAADTPPFLVVSSDNRGDAPGQAGTFVKALQAAGVEAEWFTAEGLDHGGVNTELGKADNPITQKVVGFLTAHD
ncbi:MAG: alpha/beta hydrolase [Alphaproteobacteria bacterium]|nr:alpha/beta hydrolase [Alphaproteobacteria bacterium]